MLASAALQGAVVFLQEKVSPGRVTVNGENQ